MDNIFDTVAENSLEIGKDLAVKILWDSINAGRVKLDTANLVDRLIGHGIYIVAIEDTLLNKGTGMDYELYRALMGVIGKSGMDVIVKMLRGKPYTLKHILISNMIGESIGYVWNMLSDTVGKPANGGTGGSARRSAPANQHLRTLV